ncbi:MAG: hypothetical protein HOP29_03630 [Phycisphaerales bacterium]|nr:hypothetical protein [Phycisphaerales bacterium]
MQALNLMPPEMRRRRFLIDRAKSWGTLLGIAVASLAGSGFALQSRAAVLRTRCAVGDTLAEDFARARVRTEQLKSRQAAFVDKQRALNDLVRSKHWSDVVRRVAGAADDAIWLWELRLHHDAKPSGGGGSGAGFTNGVGGESAEESTLPSARLVLSGFAVNNSEFASFLSRLNNIAGIRSAEPKLVRTGSLLNGTLLEFSIAAVVDPAKGARETRAMLAPATAERLAFAGDRRPGAAP